MAIFLVVGEDEREKYIYIYILHSLLISLLMEVRSLVEGDICARSHVTLTKKTRRILRLADSKILHTLPLLILNCLIQVKVYFHINTKKNALCLTTANRRVCLLVRGLNMAIVVGLCIQVLHDVSHKINVT